MSLLATLIIGFLVLVLIAMVGLILVYMEAERRRRNPFHGINVGKIYEEVNQEIADEKRRKADEERRSMGE